MKLVGYPANEEAFSLVILMRNRSASLTSFCTIGNRMLHFPKVGFRAAFGREEDCFSEFCRTA